MYRHYKDSRQRLPVQEALRMDFLKAVILAVLIHILAPLVVEYVEGSLSVNRTYDVQENRGEHGSVSRLHR